MKILLSLVAVIAFTACSSAKKQEAAPETATVVEQKTEAPAVADTVKEAPAKKAKQAATPSTETSTGGTFPAITGTEKSSTTCSMKTDSRKISVLNVTEGGCGVVYNKMGADQTVAMAKVDMSYCDARAANIKSNLEAAGFNCGGATGTSSDQKAE